MKLRSPAGGPSVPAVGLRAATLRNMPFTAVALVGFASAVVPPGPVYPVWLAGGFGCTVAARAVRAVLSTRHAAPWLQMVPLVLAQAGIAMLAYSMGTDSGFAPLFILAPVYSSLYGRRRDTLVAVLAGVVAIAVLALVGGIAPVVIVRRVVFWAALLSTVTFTIHSLRSRLSASASEAEERSREASVLQDAMLALTVDLDPERVLMNATRLAATLASPPSVSARRAHYFVLRGDSLIIVADSDETGASAVDMSVPLAEHPLVMRVLGSGDAVVSEIDAAQFGPTARRMILLLGITHGAYVPVRVHESIHGVLIVSSRGQPVGPHLVERLRALATLTELALTNAMALRQAAADASTDSLTGRGNRRAFNEALDAISGRRPFAFVIVDVDGLKAVNDTHGHVAGDEVLRAVASALAGAVRAGELLARHGGDEFAVVIPDAAPETPINVSARIRDAVDAIALPTGPVSISVGHAMGAPGHDPHLVFEQADLDLYRRRTARRARPRIVELGHG